MSLYLGVDGGGSKTLAVLTDKTGAVLGVGLGGAGNFQGPGVSRARAQVKKSIDEALREAGAREEDISGAFFGMAGADRPRDFEIVRELLAPLLTRARWNFENDVTIGLWAGTLDGVGVGVVCGTGTNVIGVNGKGERLQVGGMGTMFGDYAGGSFIAELAIARAMRGFEGRGEPTALYNCLCEYYGVSDLLDLVDWMYEGKSLRFGGIVPLVVDTAIQGDLVARAILEDVGEEMALGVIAAMNKLFTKEEEVKVVGMGSVFQKSKAPIMYDAFVHRLKQSEYSIFPRVLFCEPVFGAVYGALAQRDIKVDPAFVKNLEITFPGRPE